MPSQLSSSSLCDKSRRGSNRSFTTIRPAVSKSAKEINSNWTGFVSLIHRSDLSSSTQRCPQLRSRSIFFTASSDRLPLFPFPPIPFLFLSSFSIHLAPVCSRAPTIPYRNLSCASSIFLGTISLTLLQGNRPNADAARVHPAKIVRLSRQPIRPGTCVRTSDTFAIGNFCPSPPSPFSTFTIDEIKRLPRLRFLY